VEARSCGHHTGSNELMVAHADGRPRLLRMPVARGSCGCSSTRVVRMPVGAASADARRTAAPADAHRVAAGRPGHTPSCYRRSRLAIVAYAASGLRASIGREPSLLGYRYAVAYCDRCSTARRSGLRGLSSGIRSTSSASSCLMPACLPSEVTNARITFSRCGCCSTRAAAHHRDSLPRSVRNLQRAAQRS